MNIYNNKPSIPTSWKDLSGQQFTNLLLSSVELISNPTELVASENVQAFKFVPTESGTEIFSKVEILITSATPIGQQLILSGFGVDVTLTSSSTPTFEEFFTDNTGTVLAKQRVAQSVVNELNNNLAFSNYYEIYAEDTKITIIARTASPNYDLTITTLPTSFTLLNNVGGVSQYSYVDFIDYSTFADIFIGNGVYGDTINRFDFNLVGNVDVPFSDAESYINVQNAVKNYVDVVLPQRRQNVGFDFKLLDKFANDLGLMPILRPYFITFGDSYRYTKNSEKKRILQGVSDVIWVQNSAQHKLDAYFLENYVWDAGKTVETKFLTDRPNLTPITYNSHEYLQVIHKRNNKANGYFWLEVVYHFYDGSNNIRLFNGLGASYSALEGNLSFDVSPVAMGVENAETVNGKLVDYYEVYLKWTKTPTSPVYISEKKSYKMLRRCGDQSTNIIWFNKFGGWDSLEFLGTVQTNKTVETTILNRPLPFTANGRVGNILSSDSSKEVDIVTRIDSSDQYQITSHLLPKNHIKWVGGLLDSTSVFIWDNVQNQYKSIIVGGYEYSYDTDFDEFAIRINYTYTVSNNTISR